nr:MAG TPA: hypothetical protein [Caudoviricetes sp.]
MPQNIQQHFSCWRSYLSMLATIYCDTLSYLLYIAKVGQVFYSTKYLSKYFRIIIVSCYITSMYDSKCQ